METTISESDCITSVRQNLTKRNWEGGADQMTSGNGGLTEYISLKKKKTNKPTNQHCALASKFFSHGGRVNHSETTWILGLSKQVNKEQIVGPKCLTVKRSYK